MEQEWENFQKKKKGYFGGRDDQMSFREDQESNSKTSEDLINQKAILFSVIY